MFIKSSFWYYFKGKGAKIVKKGQSRHIVNKNNKFSFSPIYGQGTSKTEDLS